MESRGRRAVEHVKTLLIFILILSAVWLLGKARIYPDLSAGPGWLRAITGGDGVSETKNPAGQTGSDSGLLPVRIAVCNENGRYGVQYDAEAVMELYETELGAVLGEALAGAGERYTISEREWRRALSDEGVSLYYDFLGSVPLSALSGWLDVKGGGLGTDDARRILLVPVEGAAVLYYTGSSGHFYARDSAMRIKRLYDIAGDVTPNHTLFAFLQEGRYPNLDPYVMILPDPPAPYVYTASNPIASESSEEGDLGALLRSLSFHPQTSALYPVAGGQAVREGTDILRISKGGTVTFHASDSRAPRYLVPDESEGAMVEAARALVESALGERMGHAQLFLSGTEKLTGGAVAVYFGYLLDGAAVELGNDGYAARVVIGGGMVTDYTFHYRSYQKTEKTSAILPEIQAVAAMNALDTDRNELQLCYVDMGAAQVEAGWIAK